MAQINAYLKDRKAVLLEKVIHYKIKSQLKFYTKFL